MELSQMPHKRFNPLNGEWVLVSPQRSTRPWKGKHEPQEKSNVTYDPHCYLCPQNKRANLQSNPDYTSTYSFPNDFPALVEDPIVPSPSENELFQLKSVRGLCKVICFSPRHDMTLAQMSTDQITEVIQLWQREFQEISAKKWVKSILIFENKGEIMGCSNPHPHGQIWAQGDLPNEIAKESAQQLDHFNSRGEPLLHRYLREELSKKIRVVCENDSFVSLVPYWAIWPFETIIIGRVPKQNILQFTQDEVKDFADILKRMTVRYDNLFQTSFPYSAGMHQAPVNDGEHPEWQWHMHFYPPLLRSASIKKYMVGYELLGTPGRDITPEEAAQRLRETPHVHYLNI